MRPWPWALQVMESSVQDVLTTVAGSMWAQVCRAAARSLFRPGCALIGCGNLWGQGVYVFLALKQLKDAQFCVDRALSLQPSSATSHYLAGLLHEAWGAFLFDLLRSA